MKKLLTIILLIGLLTSCREKFDPKTLNNTHWVLQQLPGLILPADTKATLNFASELKISGKSFCNNYGGQVQVQDDKIELKNVFGTKMFCQETAEAESAYLNALSKVNQAKLVNNQLQLFDDNTLLLVFKKVD